MNTNIKETIEKRYQIQLNNIMPGPRQFVAETYIFEDQKGQKYFSKLIRYTKYTDRTIQSLPVLEQLYESGITDINYPIKTRSGELFVLDGETLIILFNFIDATQTFGYDNRKLGTLIAEIHAKSKEISSNIPKEDFLLLYKEDFEQSFGSALNPLKTDKYIDEMHKILQGYKDEIRADWKNFANIIQKCRDISFDFVLTHGDAPGNVLVDKEQNIYLIDWDTILLAPAERDTWFLAESDEFMSVYKAFYPQYEMNLLAYKFYLYNRYFEDMLGFIDEVLSDKSDEHREKNLNDLKKDCFDKWLRPLIRKLPN